MKPLPFMRNAYNYDMDEASLESGLNCPEKTLTQQHFAEEVNINTIVERFNLTGQMPQLQQLPEYADYEGIFDFQSAMNQIREAQETFMALPAKLRARFHNQPQEFLEFCADKENLDEARKLGILAPPAPTPEPTGETRGPDPSGSPQSAPQGRADPSGASTAPSARNGPQAAGSEAPGTDRR